MSTCAEWVEDLLDAAAESRGGEAARMIERCGAGCAARKDAEAGILQLRAAAADSGCETRADHAAFLAGALSVAVEEAEGGIVMRLGKERCSCPMALELPEDAGMLCECTRGHEKAVWSAYFGRPVEVEIVESRLRGGSDCVLKILV